MILITGAAGFIGSALACALNRRGHSDLILCDGLGYEDKWKNLLGLHFQELVDIDDLFSCLESKAWGKEIEAVLHMGACSDTTERDVDYLMDNNYQYSCKLCKWALDNNARFVYASSAAVYGDGSLGFHDNDDLTPKLKPLNAYGFSKWLFDMWILENKLSDKVAGLRYFNVFGPNEYHKDTMASVVFRSFPMAMNEGLIKLFESHRPDYKHGEQARDFIYIEEVISATLFILDNPKVNGIFNIGTGKAHTFNELASASLEALGKPKNIEYFPMPEEIRDRYQYHTIADMSKLYNAGFAPFEDKFYEYVKKYVSEYLKPGFLKYQDV